MDIRDDRLCSALTQAKILGPEIAALLHSAYHDGVYLPDGRVAERITEARKGVEKLLVAVLAAEQTVFAPSEADLEAMEVGHDR